MELDTKFTIGEINFDEIYDLIDYDRTGSNSSSALENESPKSVPKSNPIANSSTVNELNSKTGKNLITTNHSSYAYDLQTFSTTSFFFLNNFFVNIAQHIKNLCSTFSAARSK